MILLVALIALAASLTSSYLATPLYASTARFIITPGASLERGTDIVSSLNTLDRRSIAATYGEVMSSDRIFESSLRAMQLDPSQNRIYDIQAVVLPDANVLELRVTGPDPKLANEIANQIGNETILFSRSLNMVYDLNFLDTATHPNQPFTPQPLRDAGISLMLGAIAGAALAIVSEQIRIPLETYRQRMRLDSNTGVYNKRYFRQIVEEESVKDDADGQLSIGIVELSGMKDLLDSLPPSGLQYLFNNVTSVLRKELRGNDILGRWDDISFSILLPTTPGAAAKRTFDRIYQALSRHVILGAYGVTVNLEPHIGGAVYCNPITAQDLFSKAEDALEKARASNESPVFLWELNSPFWVQEEAKSLSEIS